MSEELERRKSESTRECVRKRHICHESIGGEKRRGCVSVKLCLQGRLKRCSERGVWVPGEAVWVVVEDVVHGDVVVVDRVAALRKRHTKKVWKICDGRQRTTCGPTIWLSRAKEPDDA
eukprot:6191623-Pleurochrysis_carterae.AAC.2